MSTPHESEISPPWFFECEVKEQEIVEIMGRRPRLLVVDDQAANVQALFRVFSNDHQIFMAMTGAQALSACLEKLPDLVLLDIEMPDIDGFEVCKRLKANPVTKNIPIIFVTSHDSETTEAHGLSLGAVDFVTKPIKKEIVRARVRTHLLLKHQSDLLRQWVYMDGLTGAFNRRHFNERYASEFGRARRSGGPLSVIFVDVDHFKKYNDHYGHQMGDDALRQVATAMKKAAGRPTDMVARYGGEEFVVLLPETNAQGAYIVAKEINQAIRNLRIEHVKSQEHAILTISVGVATYHPGCKSNSDELLKLADECLYRAKMKGRNRVCSILAPFSTDAPPTPQYLPPHIDRDEDHYGP